jgi:hypothetical protein
MQLSTSLQIIMVLFFLPPEPGDGKICKDNLDSMYGTVYPGHGLNNYIDGNAF